jgi:hypothetical protein
MKLYRFSPIYNEHDLLVAIHHIHFSCARLCFEAMGRYLPNAGNIGVFCHYGDEYEKLIEIRKQLTEPSDNVDQKYFLLHKPIIIPAEGGVPQTTYTYLYIRKPDPYRHHAGDVDYYLPPEEYNALKQSLLDEVGRPGIRVFSRTDLDMVELHHPDVDALGYISTEMMVKAVHVKISELI